MQFISIFIKLVIIQIVMLCITIDFKYYLYILYSNT
jgi:hypothetical protein